MATKRETILEYRRMEEAQGPLLERRITYPRIQASRPEETAINKKEEIREQNNEKEETDKSSQSASSHPNRETIQGKKDKEKDEFPKAPNESKPQKRNITQVQRCFCLDPGRHDRNSSLPSKARAKNIPSHRAKSPKKKEHSSR
ncbi:hypothetical protein Tco_1442350 [Tanacetum coccineum]